MSYLVIKQNNHSLAEIKADHKQKQLFPKDSSLNVVVGTLQESDQCIFEITIEPTFLAAFMDRAGYSQQNIHALPSKNKKLFAKAITKAMVNAISKENPSGFLIYFDEAAPKGFAFTRQSSSPTSKDNDTSPLTPSPHPNSQSKSEAKPDSESIDNIQNQWNQQEYHLRVLRQAQVQQQDAVKDEEEKKKRRLKKHQEQRQRQYQQRPYWQQHDNGREL